MLFIMFISNTRIFNFHLSSLVFYLSFGSKFGRGEADVVICHSQKNINKYFSNIYFYKHRVYHSPGKNLYYFHQIVVEKNMNFLYNYKF